MSTLRHWKTGVPALAVVGLLIAWYGGSESPRAAARGVRRAGAVSAGRAPAGKPARPRRSDIVLHHSVSLGLEDVAAPATDWSKVERNLNAAGVNMIYLSAGRVEFTAFDWPAHPDVADQPGHDWLRTAIQALRREAGGQIRPLDIMVDTLVPQWIKHDRSIAAVDASGNRSQYYASASALYDGPVGDRIVDYVGEIARRYTPTEISLTELMFEGGSFGENDLQLFRRMTGRRDWPRTPSGSIDESDPSIGIWRSRVLAHLLSRLRAEVRQVERGSAHQTLIAIDAEVNWDDPAAGRPDVGDDYNILAQAADRITLWAYIGSDGKGPADVRRLTGALIRGFPNELSRFTVSIGLWGPDASTVVSPDTLAAAVQAAETNGITSVNVTPMSLMTPAHWQALRDVWGSR